MNISKSSLIILLFICLVLPFASCKKNNTRDDGKKNGADNDISLSDVDIEKKYLIEGFISPDIYRIVIVTPKNTNNADQDSIKNRAKKRARVSLERNLQDSNTTVDRNIKAEILNLIEQNGQFNQKDIEHKRYDVYYFEIKKKNMKNYLKNMCSQK